MSEHTDKLRADLYAARDEAARRLPPEHRHLAQTILELAQTLDWQQRGEEALERARRLGDPNEGWASTDRRYLAEGTIAETLAALQAEVSPALMERVRGCLLAQDGAAFTYWREEFERVLGQLAECFPGLRGGLLVTAVYLFAHPEARATDDYKALEVRFPI